MIAVITGGARLIVNCNGSLALFARYLLLQNANIELIKLTRQFSISVLGNALQDYRINQNKNVGNKIQ